MLAHARAWTAWGMHALLDLERARRPLWREKRKAARRALTIRTGLAARATRPSRARCPRARESHRSGATVPNHLVFYFQTGAGGERIVRSCWKQDALPLLTNKYSTPYKGASQCLFSLRPEDNHWTQSLPLLVINAHREEITRFVAQAHMLAVAVSSRLARLQAQRDAVDGAARVLRA